MSSAATSMALADTACSLARFPVLEDLSHTTATIGASLPSLEPSRNRSVAQVNEQRRETNELPIDLSLSAQSLRR